MIGGESWGGDEVKRMVKGLVVREKERLRAMERALRAVKGS